MWNTDRDRQPAAHGQGRPRPARRWLLLVGVCGLLVGGAACRQDMQDTPRYEVYEANPNYADGASMRPLVEGTVPRGWLREDVGYYMGKRAPGGSTGAIAPGGSNQGQGAVQPNTPNVVGGDGGSQSGAATNVRGNVAGTLPVRAGGAGGSSNDYPDAVTEFPLPVTKEVLDRGQERYQIYCSMCHGATGYGDGMIVRRGYRRPPSYHDDRLRQAPVGHFFDVITNGWGAMPDYAAQIPVQDRWAIIAYVRALQLSQQVPVQQLTDAERARMQQQQQRGAGGAYTQGGGEQH